MDPVEALKHVRTLIRVASQSDDVEAIHKNLEEAEAIIDKALPSARNARQAKVAPASKRPASPLDKILDEPRIGLGNFQTARKPIEQ